MFEGKIVNIISEISENEKFIAEQNLKHLEFITELGKNQNENIKFLKECFKEINFLKDDVALLQELVLFLKKNQDENDCNCEHKLKEKICKDSK